MGCCAQTNLGQTAFGFTAQGFKFDSSTKMLPKEITTDKKEISGDNFIRISIYHKTLGKEHFLKKEYQQAIMEFTKAINYCPQISIYYSNRALCYKAQREWAKALEDSRQAVFLDETNIKALDVLAESLIELERKDPKKTVFLKEAVIHLERAYKVALERKGDDVIEAIVKELDIKLKRARKMLYLKSQNTEDPKKEELSKFVRGLIGQHEKDVNKKAEFLELFEQYKKEKERGHTIDIPDYFNCKISYEIMKDPKVTPDGISYEGSVLNEHFVRVGYFDPVTRREVDSTMLVSNNNLKKAIDHFYKTHPDHFEPDKKNFMEIDI